MKIFAEMKRDFSKQFELLKSLFYPSKIRGVIAICFLVIIIATFPIFTNTMSNLIDALIGSRGIEFATGEVKSLSKTIIVWLGVFLALSSYYANTSWKIRKSLQGILPFCLMTGITFSSGRYWILVLLFFFLLSAARKLQNKKSKYITYVFLYPILALMLIDALAVAVSRGISVGDYVSVILVSIILTTWMSYGLINR